MNSLLVLLLIFSGVYACYAAFACCNYPALNSISSANVSQADYNCFDVIHLTCEKKGDYVAAAFIYNYTKGATPVNTGMEGEKVELDIECNHRTKLWRNVPGGSKLYKSYGCSFKTKNGVWVIE